MHSLRRLFVSSLLLGCAMSACSGAATPGESASGGATPASGGATGSGGSSSSLPGAGTGGATGSPATGGAGTEVTPGGTGGSNVTTPGTGGSTATPGTGGRTQTGPGAGTGGSTGAGGSASSSGGSTGSGGVAGPKPDQNALPAITIHMAGDSTMSNYAATTTQEGWGQEFGQFFISKVSIDNQALGGANIDTFYTGRWKTLINNLKAGDFVFAAFGINDSGTTHGPVTPAAFQARMATMADEVAAKKATFIPTTSSPLQVWTGGKETNARLQPYCDATIAVGMSKSLLVDDLNARGVEYYNSIGQTAAAALTFNGDKAHFDKQGATQMAELAAKELTRINSPLAAYLK